MHNTICYSYMIAASGLWSIHEWLSSDRAQGRSLSGLSKLKPRVLVVLILYNYVYNIISIILYLSYYICTYFWDHITMFYLQ